MPGTGSLVFVSSPSIPCVYVSVDLPAVESSLDAYLFAGYDFSLLFIIRSTFRGKELPAVEIV